MMQVKKKPKVIIKYYIEKLQVRSIKLHIAYFLQHHLLHLVAVLLLLLPALLLRLVDTLQSRLHFTHWLEGLLLALVTDLPGLLLAVLGVAVLLGLLGASLHLQLADLLGLEVTVLFLHGEGEDIGELLAVPVNISLAHFYLDFSGNVVAIMLGSLLADDTLGPIAIVLSALVPLAVELETIGASYVIDDFLLHVTIRSLKVRALVVILGGHVNLVGGVAHPVLPREAPLHLVGFLQGLVVDGLDKVAHQLIHIEADTLDAGLDDPRAVVVKLGLAFFLILRPAGGLCVGLALVLEHHLLHHVSVGVLVDAVPPHIVLPNIRTVLLCRGRGWVFRRGREARHEGQEGEEDSSLDHTC